MSTTELVLTCLSEKVDHKRKSKTMAPKKKKAAGDKPSQPIPQRRRGRPVIKIRARKSLPTPLSSPPLPQPKTAALSSWIESHATLLPNPAADYTQATYSLDEDGDAILSLDLYDELSDAYARAQGRAAAQYDQSLSRELSNRDMAINTSAYNQIPDTAGIGSRTGGNDDEFLAQPTAFRAPIAQMTASCPAEVNQHSQIGNKSFARSSQTTLTSSQQSSTIAPSKRESWWKQKVPDGISYDARNEDKFWRDETAVRKYLTATWIQEYDVEPHELMMGYPQEPTFARHVLEAPREGLSFIDDFYDMDPDIGMTGQGSELQGNGVVLNNQNRIVTAVDAE